MSDCYNPPFKHSESHISLLSVIESVIQNRYRFIVKQPIYADEINAMFLEIGLSFALVPVKLHLNKCNYKM